MFILLISRPEVFFNSGVILWRKKRRYFGGTSPGLADVTPPPVLCSASWHVLPPWKFLRTTTNPELRGAKKPAAARDSMRYHWFNRQNMSAVFRQLSQRASGSARRVSSSATHRENQHELGDSTSVSAPNFASSPKTRTRKVTGQTVKRCLVHGAEIVLQFLCKHRPGQFLASGVTGLKALG